MQRLICDTMIPLLLLAGIFAGLESQSLAVDADLLLRGGTIYDGSGDDGRVGDVAIQGEKIVAVGHFDVGEVKREIDCTGLVITPGFIDLHTHCDSTIVKQSTRKNLNYLTQGCTTVVTGNCGGGKGDVAAFLHDVDKNGSGTNIAHLVPQGRVRGAVIGSEPRPATDEEITKMQKLVDEIAKEENKHVVDLVLELHALGGVKAVNFCMSEDDVCFGMNTAWVATASDGSGHVASPTATLHPRSFGTFPRKIGLFAIQREVIPLGQAIRSCTGLPADIFGFTERGYLRPGYYADVLVFDPKTFIDRATFEKPAVYSTGVCHLLLAGDFAIEDGKPSEKLFGRALRHQSALVEKPIQ